MESNHQLTCACVSEWNTDFVFFFILSVTINKMQNSAALNKKEKRNKCVYSFFFFLKQTFSKREERKKIQLKRKKTRAQIKMSTSNRTVQERTPCEKFVQRLMGIWSGIGDTEGLNRNTYMSNLKITHNPREPGKIGSAIVKSQTSDPDPRIQLNFAAFWKCGSGPKDISFIVHYQEGNVEIVKGLIEDDEGSAATMESDDRLSTGNPRFLATKHRWFFDKKGNDEVRPSATSNRFANVDRVHHAVDPKLVKRADTPMAREKTKYVDDDCLIRHFWVATEEHPRLELIQRTKYTTNHHSGGDQRRKDLSQLSANAAFY